MHVRRPLVLVVHDDPRAALAQANGLTRAGYRCLVTGDSATALWFAMRLALEAATLDVTRGCGRLRLARELQEAAAHPGIVLLSPTPILAADLPENTVCLLSPAVDSELVDAVERASRLRFARPSRTLLMSRSFGAVPPPMVSPFSPADTVPCS